MLSTTVPVERRLLAVLYSDDHGFREAAKYFGHSTRSIQKWKRTLETTGTVADPISHRGKKRKLSTAEEDRLVKIARREKGITNVALARRTGNKVQPRTVSDILARSGIQFTMKLTHFDYRETFTHKHVEEGVSFISQVKKISWPRRIYVDETWLGPQVRKKRSRVEKGTSLEQPIAQGPKLTVISAITAKGVLPITNFFVGREMTNDDFEKWVKTRLLPHVTPGQVIFWDQLGKYGAEKHPYRKHWSPKVRQLIEGVGAKVMMLPSKGKLFNPIELFFRDTKAKYISTLPCFERQRNGPKLHPRTMKTLWNKAQSSTTAERFQYYFEQRANGKEFVQVCKQRQLL